MKRVFSLFICVLLPPLKHFQLFTWNSIFITMLMGFKLEFRAPERMKLMFLHVGPL